MIDLRCYSVYDDVLICMPHGFNQKLCETIFMMYVRICICIYICLCDITSLHELDSSPLNFTGVSYYISKVAEVSCFSPIQVGARCWFVSFLIFINSLQ